MRAMIKQYWPVLAMVVGVTLLWSAMMNPSASAAPDGAASDAQISDSAQPAPSTGEAKAPEVKPAETSPVDQAKGVWDAFKGGKYREAIAGVLVLVVFFWRRFGAKFIIGKLSTWQVGLLTVVVGLIATIPEALAATTFDWKTFVWSGLLTSAQAMLVWKTVGQKILPKVFGESAKPDPVAPDPVAADPA